MGQVGTKRFSIQASGAPRTSPSGGVRRSSSRAFAVQTRRMAATTALRVPSRTSKPVAVEVGTHQERLPVATHLARRRPTVDCYVRAADIEDVEQEVLLGVSRGLAKLDPGAAEQGGRKLRGWLFGICCRQAASYQRSQARRAESTFESDVFDGMENGQRNPEDQLAGARWMALLMKLVARLPPDRRAVFVAYEIEETPIAEIAVTLSIPENTAWNRLRLARSALARALRRRQVRTPFPW